MQSDPVSGEMVMSAAYHFDLKNGQRLRFATDDTLTQFLQDPVRCHAYPIRPCLVASDTTRMCVLTVILVLNLMIENGLEER